MTHATYLELADRTNAEQVVAVEFHACDSLRLALSESGIGATQETADEAAVDITFAGDGGPVRRSSMTIFTITISTPLLRGGRSPLMPILVLLGGEQEVHLAVGRRLRAQVQTALRTTYGIPAAAPHFAGSSRSLRLKYHLRLCGDFAMLCHFLSLTGGRHVFRCPFRRSCTPATYLDVSTIHDTLATQQTTAQLSSHWELTVWVRARSCALRGGAWKFRHGPLVWPCHCGAYIDVRMPSNAIESCSNPQCKRAGVPAAEVLALILNTPLSREFRLLRLRLGGPRGHAVLGAIPFLLQAPVLHCTGKSARRIIFFLLALLTEA